MRRERFRAESKSPIAQARRLNSLCSLSDDELSPAALAARVVLAECARAAGARRTLGRAPG